MNNKIEQLLSIMQRLRDPEKGCPWDLQQDFASIAVYTIEEAYELADAIERSDLADLKDELGDLLLQVVFHSQMAAEQQAFDFEDVVQAICEKMVRRHPHVFGGEGETAPAVDVESVKQSWENIKALERAGKTQEGSSVLDDVPRGMAELQRAAKIQKRAASAGFDWSTAEQVMEKLREETAELEIAIQQRNSAAMQDELGDLLFTWVNVARKLQIDPAQALRFANFKFEQRFRALEKIAGGKSVMQQMGIQELEDIWQTIKKAEIRQEETQLSAKHE